MEKSINPLDVINRALHAEVIERKRAEEALRTSETRWYTLFAEAAVGLSEISLQGKFERVNDKYCSLMGRSRSALLVGNLVDVTHHEDLHHSLTLFRRVVATGQPESLDLRYIRPDGDFVWANVRMTRLEDPSGRPRAILAVAIDLTDRKSTEIALHRSEAEFRAFFELAAVGIAQVDAQRKTFLRVNQRFAEMVGYNEFELRQMSFVQLGDADTEAYNLELFHQLVNGRISEYSLEKRLRRKNGTYFWANVTASLVRDLHQKPVRTVAVVQDITERKMAEESLRLAQAQLELRVRERTAELDQVNRALMAEILERKRAEEERQSVLRQLVTAQEEERRKISRELHDEIGQHLTALMLGLKALEQGSAIAIAPGHLEKLQQITEVVGKEVHELALGLRPTALDDLGLARTLTNYLEEWADRVCLELDFHHAGIEDERLPSSIETTIYRIVQEALTNVVKHACAKRISVIVERQGDHAIAIVEDDGCGFDLDLLVSAETRKRLGLLGMEERASLVRGELRIESSPGNGTTVFVRIPLSPSHQP